MAGGGKRSSVGWEQFGVGDVPVAWGGGGYVLGGRGGGWVGGGVEGGVGVCEEVGHGVCGGPYGGGRQWSRRAVPAERGGGGVWGGGRGKKEGGGDWGL